MRRTHWFRVLSSFPGPHGHRVSPPIRMPTSGDSPKWLETDKYGIYKNSYLYIRQGKPPFLSELANNFVLMILNHFPKNKVVIECFLYRICKKNQRNMTNLSLSLYKTNILILKNCNEFMWRHLWEPNFSLSQVGING